MAKKNTKRGSKPVAEVIAAENDHTFNLTESENTVSTATETPAAENPKGKSAPRRAAAPATLPILQTLNLDPSRIEILPEMTGRTQPIPESELVELAESMRRNGQLQPIQIREKGETPGYFTAVFGISRLRAANLIRSGYTLGDKEIKGDPSFTIRCDVVAVDDETAFVRNVTENAARKQCSPIDNARNQQRLRDEYGMSDAAITRLYGYSSQASVSRLKKLLVLPEDIQQAIHRGECTQAAGFLLADLVSGKEPATAEELTAVYLAAVDASKGEEAVAADAVVAAIKAFRKAKAAPVQTPDAGTSDAAPDADAGTSDATPDAEAGTSDAAPAPDAEVTFAMTLKQFKDWLREMGSDPKCPEHVERATVFFLDVLAGKHTKPEFAAWFVKNLVK